MLRSGVNGLVTMRERIVLPRVADLASGAVDLWEAWAGHWTESRRLVDEFAPDGEGVEFAAADFADAFLTMPLLEHERKYVVVKGVSNWYVFRSVAFGLTSGPLLWGRLAAAVARLTQATFLPWEAQLQCYVDDPGLSIAGPSRRERSCILARALLFWSIIGITCQLEETSAWTKA